jgi:alkylation response protein AidB-like acyl-CoA dehydrogenase
MDVSLSPEQEMLRETAAALAERIGPSTPHDLDPAATPEDDPPREKHWSLLADAGLLGLGVPAASGGSGASPVEIMIVAEALASRACPVPYLGSTLALDLLVAAGADDALVGAVAAGQRHVTIALDPALGDIATVAALDRAVAWDARGADAALVLDEDSALAAIPVAGDQLDGADLTRSVVRLGSARGERVELGHLGRPIAPATLTRWRALALSLLAADVVGAMDGALVAAVDYSKERVQFDTRIGTFQAIQHLCADAYVLLEGSRSATWYAAWAVDAERPERALLAARTAKTFASQSGVTVAETSIQVHGGVAITWEYMPHVFLRRILLDRATLGAEQRQLRAIADERQQRQQRQRGAA